MDDGFCLCMNFGGGLPTGFEGNLKDEKPLGVLLVRAKSCRLLGALVLGDGLGSFGDGVLGEFTGEDETDGGLDLAGGHGLALVVHDETSCFTGDTPEGVTDEGVQDAHGPLGDYGVRVDLLEDAVDVDVVGLPRSAAVFPALGSSSWPTLADAWLGLVPLENHLDLLSFLYLGSVKNVGKL